MLLNLIFALFLALKPISIKVTPSIGVAPLDVRVTVITDPNPDNEYTCVQWDGGDAGSSCWDMLGDREPPQKSFWIKSLSPGDYTIMVRLHRHSGQDFTALTQIEIN